MPAICKTTLVTPQQLNTVWSDAIADINAFENAGQEVKSLLLCSSPTQVLLGRPHGDDPFKVFCKVACNANVLRYPGKLGKCGVEEGFASWLMRAGGSKDDLRILVDCGLLRGSFLDRNRLQFRMARILLHEVAHIKYHYNYAFPTNHRGALGCTSKPEYEAVAWLYAGIVTGIALGEKSYLDRNGGLPDTVWSLL